MPQDAGNDDHADSEDNVDDREPTSTDARSSQPVGTDKDAAGSIDSIDSSAGDSNAGDMGNSGGSVEADGTPERDTGTNEGADDDASASEAGTSSPAAMGQGVDPCVPNPCGASLSCVRGEGEPFSCVAPCASTTLGCQPGDACGSDADCQTGDARSSCDATDHVCVTVCPATTIVSQATLDGATFCREIDGDLKIEPDFAEISEASVPYLTRVRGHIVAVGGVGGVLAVESITLPALQTVDGQINLSLVTSLRVLSLPSLQMSGGFIIANNGALTQLSAPQLATVAGDFQVSVNRSLERIDLGRLSAVVGQLKLTTLCKIPWTQLQRVSILGSDQMISGIGCCNMSTDRFACNGDCSCN